MPTNAQCVVQYSSLFDVMRENEFGPYDITYAGHYEKLLCSDNDSRYHSRKMKVLSSDWTAQSCRLLIHDSKLSPDTYTYDKDPRFRPSPVTSVTAGRVYKILKGKIKRRRKTLEFFEVCT